MPAFAAVEPKPVARACSSSAWLPEGAELPDWFAADQLRLFVRLETRLAALMPGRDAAAVKRQARTLFSAVHGIVALGLEQKLVEMPVEAIDDELDGFVVTFAAGLRRTSSKAVP